MRGSPDPAQKLTAGLPLREETCGQLDGTVRRPCHNVGRETVPQRVNVLASGWKLFEDLCVCGEPVDFVFAEDHFAVGDDVEDAAAAFDERCFCAGCLFNCCRQTGGLGGVVSLYAVGD